MAGFLSFLVPGLGHLYLGRVGKGLLFLVCLYGLFFYGMSLGDWKNVYLPDTARDSNPWKLPGALANVYNRLHYAGQFWIGIVAWPALWQYNQLPVPSAETSPFWHEFQRTPSEEVLNKKQTEGDKTWDLGWVFTVIAGVLNILVIYDAFAGPAFRELELELRPQKEAVPA
ncbi:MAG: hypothetical protein L0Z62_12280 [Gemmataceae bacterium]|nr:hypothetical protein [Gemmataceae bacterium]